MDILEQAKRKVKEIKAGCQDKQFASPYNTGRTSVCNDIISFIDNLQKEPKSGADLIAAERNRQMEAEGYSPEHDDKHKPEEFAMAAIAYALPEWMRWTYKGECEWWPFEKESFKPSPDDRVRELVKAGALIAAEIDRIQRTGIQYLYDEEADEWYLPGSAKDKEIKDNRNKNKKQL